MKNIQVIDGATNCSYSICRIEDSDFVLIFPAKDQNVEFVEDLVKRLGEARAGELVIRATTRRIPKENAMGIHGTLFFQLYEKRKYYPNKQDADIADPPFIE